MTETTTQAQGVAAPRQLFRNSGDSLGDPLEPGSAEFLRARLEGRRLTGRVTPLDAASFATISLVRVGERVRLPLSDFETVEGKVNLVSTEADGTVRLGGILAEGQGSSFSLHQKAGEVGGSILRPRAGLAYRIEQDSAGTVWLREVLLSDVICAPLPRLEDGQARTALLEALSVPPILNSRPAATAQLYLDFDGETVTDPAWNGGNTIVAVASNSAPAEITDIFNRVKEDFLPFNINVTTDVTKYNSAPVGSRMRCIITPTDTAAPGAGGVAYLDCFDRAGSDFSDTIPCWVFNTSVLGISEAVSHEFGHTLGLDHDGRRRPFEEYFEGHGSGPTSWAPIMGVGYFVTVVQWSKGEYQRANNTEDDVAIISNATNGFGYAGDEAGGTIASAAALQVNGLNVDQFGVITQASDVDFYSFTTGTGTVSFNATPASLSPNLDISLEIHDASGTVQASANPAAALPASLSTILTEGTYYLRVAGSGAGDPLTDGYSNYGSIGAYTLTGTIATDIIYVDKDATAGANDGTSWADAFLKLQDGLSAASAGDKVLVAEGNYYPDEGTGQTNDNRNSTFQLKEGVAVYGGFDGTETTLAERVFNPDTNVSTLSGDLTQNDNPGNNTAENAFHVLSATGIGNSAILDGFTITAGKANLAGDDEGAGLFCDAASPAIVQCTFLTNSADALGGGIKNNNGSNPSVTDCRFINNSSINSGGAGIANENSSNPIITNSSFSGNTASTTGGAMASFGSAPTVINSAFYGNTSDNLGGAVHNDSGSNASYINCSFSGNKALNGGAFSNDNSNPIITNGIVWNNEANGSTVTPSSSVSNTSSSPVYSHSLVQNFSDTDLNATGGTNNLNGTDPTNDPDFTNPVDPSTAPFISGNLGINIGSPVIDAGDTATYNATTTTLVDLAGNPRIQNSIIELGAHELSPYYAWIKPYFPGITDPAVIGESADGDGDDLTNVDELKYGMDPSISFQGGITLTSATLLYSPGLPIVYDGPSPGLGDFRALFTRPSNYLEFGFSYTVQFSNDMVAWQDATVPPTLLDSAGGVDLMSTPYPSNLIEAGKSMIFRVLVDME